MIQFRVLSGKMAGTDWSARRFPVRVGRAAEADFRSEEDGVWDDHLRVQFRSSEGYVLETGKGALARVNGQELKEPAALRNGDLIEIGSLRLQFWLTPPRQRGLRVRETLTWVFIGAMCLVQVGLIYWLLRE